MIRFALFSFLVLFFMGPAYGQAPEKRFVGNCSFSGFALVSDSTYRGNITRFDDRMGDGYNLTQLATGYEVFDGRGLVFSIGTIHSSTNFTADVTVTAKADRGFEPFGSGQVYNPTASGMIPPSSQEQAGLSPTQKARIDRHNVIKMEALVGGRDSVYSITNVPDTTSLSPVTGDAFINSTADTMGLYDGSGWVLFFGGGSVETADGSTILGDGSGTPFYVNTDSLHPPMIYARVPETVYVPGCASTVPINISGMVVNSAIRAGDDITGDITISGAGGLTITYIQEEDGFAYFEAQGNLAAGIYGPELAYSGVTLSLIMNVIASPCYTDSLTSYVDRTELGDSTAAVRADFPAGDNLGDHTATENLNMAGNTILGGTGTTDDLTLQSTSGVGGTTSEIIFNVGNNGGTEAMRIRGNGNVGINASTPLQNLHVQGTARITGSDGTPTGIMGRDGDGDVSNITIGNGLDFTAGELTTREKVPVIMFLGESNSGGQADNASLSAAELDPFPGVQIYNIYANEFQTLDVGANNQINHLSANLLDSIRLTDHGWEVGLTNDFKQYGQSKIYLVKAGQGGSTVDMWEPTDTFSVLLQRKIEGARTLLRAQNKEPVWYIWFSFGINDDVAATDTTVFKYATLEWLERVRDSLYQNSPVFATALTDMNSGSSSAPYGRQLEALADSLAWMWVVPTVGLSKDDSKHWDYVGMDTIARRMGRYMRDTVGLPYARGTITSTAGGSGGASVNTENYIPVAGASDFEDSPMYYNSTDAAIYQNGSTSGGNSNLIHRFGKGNARIDVSSLISKVAYISISNLTDTQEASLLAGTTGVAFGFGAGGSFNVNRYASGSITSGSFSSETNTFRVNSDGTTIHYYGSQFNANINRIGSSTYKLGLGNATGAANVLETNNYNSWLLANNINFQNSSSGLIKYVNTSSTLGGAGILYTGTATINSTIPAYSLAFFNSQASVTAAGSFTGAVRMLLDSDGHLSINRGVTASTAFLHLGAGTATASTAPLKFTSGPLLTTPEVGAFEFLTDRLYFTQTTGATRNTIAYTSDIPSNTTTTGFAPIWNGTGWEDSDMEYDGSVTTIGFNSNDVDIVPIDNVNIRSDMIVMGEASGASANNTITLDALNNSITIGNNPDSINMIGDYINVNNRANPFGGANGLEAWLDSLSAERAHALLYNGTMDSIQTTGSGDYDLLKGWLTFGEKSGHWTLTDTSAIYYGRTIVVRVELNLSVRASSAGNHTFQIGYAPTTGVATFTIPQGAAEASYLRASPDVSSVHRAVQFEVQDGYEIKTRGGGVNGGIGITDGGIIISQVN